MAALSYLSLPDAEWTRRLDALHELFSPCMLCPRMCGAARAENEAGECRSARDAIVGSHNLHFGEEPPISGFAGSGTVFFTGCSLHCLFCQNYPISQMAHGNAVSADELASYYLELQERGAHNLNLVTPSHVNYQWFHALYIAARRGFMLPVVYNSGGYDRVPVLALFDGVIDIYMPDAKYRDSALSAKLSEAADYPEVNALALREMHRQAGPLVTDGHGVGVRGILVRHLMIPGEIDNTLKVMDDIAEINPEIPVSLMTQYFPAYKAHETPGLDRKVAREEYRVAEAHAIKLGLVNGYFQQI